MAYTFYGWSWVRGQIPTVPPPWAFQSGEFTCPDTGAVHMSTAGVTSVVAQFDPDGLQTRATVSAGAAAGNIAIPAEDGVSEIGMTVGAFVGGGSTITIQMQIDDGGWTNFGCSVTITSATDF